MSKRLALGIVAFVGLAGLVGAACSSNKTAGGGTVPAGPHAAREAPASGSAAASPALGGFRSDSNAAPNGVPDVAPRVIKTASLGLRVRNGTFDQRFQDATEVAGRYGGYVSSSETEGRTRRSGTLTLKVPATQFEVALGDLKRLGTVTDQRVSGQDVTAQFVDLEARLKNWEAQERVLLDLMANAKTIDDSITVQNHLQDVQLTIEELKGQLRVLSDQADYSTITVSMAEAGFVSPKPKAQSALVRAWHQGVDGFLGVIGAVVVAVGYLLPLGFFVLLGWAVVRRVRPKVQVPARPESV